MALKKTMQTAHGFNAVDAYHRVEVVVLPSKTRLQFHVRSYIDTSKQFFSEQVLASEYSLNAGNPIQQAYDHLKTLPEFSGAVDC